VSFVEKSKFARRHVFIGREAFEYCSRLRHVKFSSRLETIERWAFDECHDLKYTSRSPLFSG